MGRKKLTVETIAELSPGFASAVERELKNIADDLRERPGVDKARTLTIEVEFKPFGMDGKRLTDQDDAFADVTLRLKSRLPSQETVDYRVGVHPNGSIVINPAAPQDDPRQANFGDGV